MPFPNMDSEDLRRFIAEGFEISRAELDRFWLSKLNQVYGITPGLSEQIGYVATILSQFCMVPTGGNGWFLYLPQLVKVAEFCDSDHLEGWPVPPETFENAARQILFLSSFEEKYFSAHFARNDSARMGSLFFLKAAVGDKRKILTAMSDNFAKWQRRLAFFSHHLRKQSADLIREVQALGHIPRV